MNTRVEIDAPVAGSHAPNLGDEVEVGPSKHVDGDRHGMDLPTSTRRARH